MIPLRVCYEFRQVGRFPIIGGRRKGSVETPA